MISLVISFSPAWLSLLGGVWFLFKITDKTLNETTRKTITDWLNNAELPVGVENWPNWFIAGFDEVFGRRHFSIRCFLMSCIVSLCFSFILFLVWIPHRQDVGIFGYPLLAMFSDYTALIFLYMLVFLNLLPDYLSLLETRYVLQLMKRAKPWMKGLWLVIDSLTTFFIWLGGLWVFSVVYTGDILNVVDLLHDMEKYIIFFFEQDSNTDPYGVALFGVFFYTTYFTSVWAWLFILSGWTIKCLTLRLFATSRG